MFSKWSRQNRTISVDWFVYINQVHMHSLSDLGHSCFQETQDNVDTTSYKGKKELFLD